MYTVALKNVLIVAKCNVNFDLKNQFCTKESVLIVAKCNVNYGNYNKYY